MRKLLTYLGLLATLLAMPYHAKADTNYHYYLVGDFNNYAVKSSYKFGNTSNTTDKPPFKVTLTGAQLDPDKNGTALIRIGVTLDENTGGYYLSHNISNVTLSRDTKLGVTSNSQENSLKITEILQTGSYTFEFISGDGSLGPDTRNQGTISVSGPYSENTNLKLKGSYSNDNWATSTTYTSFADGIYTWEFDKSVFTSNTQFKLYEYVDGGSNDHWYSNGSEITEDWSDEFSTSANNMKVVYSDNDLIKISVQAMKSSSGWKMRIVKTYEPHDYYWVSPQITNNQKWPYFKLTALRNRSGSYGDGNISDKYFTFTIKNDDLRRYDGTAIDDGEKIEWYIARDDDAVWFRPSTDDPTPSESATSLNIGNAEGHDSNIGYRNYLNCKVTDKSNTNKFAFNKGKNSTKTGESDYLTTNVKSYTFILNSRKSDDATQGNVFFNYAHNSSPVTSGDCYLLGNFKSASEAESVCNPGDAVYPGNPYGPRKMTKYWYVGSTKYDSEQTPCDSIVYEIKVNKPAAGWGNLYLDVNPGSNTSWNKVYRPLISLGNTLDGRALIGGLTTAGANMNNGVGDQSLNPETSNDYTSYTFRFNATTYTYRLEFHTSLYLVGPGVSATEGMGSWDLSKVKSSEPSDPRIRLTATQETDHYRNLVYFTQGQPFRFIKNTDESATPNYKYTWYENTNKPKWITATDDDYYPGNETQFCNYMVYENNTGSESSTEPSAATDQSMTFDLPTGWYYVNFYPNAATPYYTIEHSMELRDFNDVYYRSAAGTAEQRNVLGRNDYNFLRVWSDHIAWNKPDNIDVFVVSAFDHNTETHVTTATLTKLNVNYIPAKTGVILGCKLSKDNLTSGLVYDNAATLAYTKGENVNYYNTLTAELTPYSAASTSYTGASQLIPLYSETSLKRFSDDTGIGTGDGYANYLFGFYRCKKYQQNYSGNDNDFQMGFWLTTGNGTTYANSAFLHLTKAQAEDLGVGTAYNTSASAPAFMLLFDESEDNVITGISDITTAKGNSVAPQGWYTLQGVRTAKPTQRGIYIYNGKKVIVND